MTHSPLRIVVIGSSTAAGTGASPEERAWVNLYHTFLQTLNPASEVINLGMGGQQTFHLLPTEHKPPPERPLPDPERNISRALALHPDAVIVNVPSNDAAARYDAEEQLANFDLILQTALAEGVPAFICTTQPRRFDPDQVRIQTRTKDAVLERYGPLAINLWDDLATGEGFPLENCDSGDGAHLNNLGHERIFQAVQKHDLPSILASAKIQPGFWQKTGEALGLKPEKKPATRRSRIKFKPHVSHQWLALPRLFRLPNLVIVFLSQWLPYWFVLRPALLQAGGMPGLNERTFGLIAAATVLTTLAGYILNDYYDREIDAINRPDRVVVGRHIPSGIVLLIYLGLTVLVHLLALRIFFLMPAPRSVWPLLVFPVVSLFLFLYAWQIKCTPLLGNVLVSLLCGAVPIIPLFPEDRTIWLTSFREPDLIHQATGLVWVYAIFAFATNLLREQVKDLEDFQGDATCGCNTLAVIKGPRVAKIPAGFVGLAVSALIGLLLYFWVENDAPTWQIGAGATLLLLPALIATALTFLATTKRHFTWASHCIKLVMLAGLFLLLSRWPDDPIAALNAIKNQY
ncbi:MAG: UbiA family prenyltransferase [Lewinellaceae bacterium]|nr:UbiA family prenyltransferase [Lewinellaceae bacterium]